MKIKYLIISLALISSLLSSCYKHEDISTEKGKPRYSIEKGTPIDDAIYDYYQKYSRFIIYKYKPLDYQWSISETSTEMELIPCFNYDAKEDISIKLEAAKEELARLEGKTTRPEEIEEQKEKIKVIEKELVDFDTPEFQEARKELESKQKDTLMMGFNVLKKVFLDLYDEDFKNKYLPYKIFICNTAHLNKNQTKKKDLKCFYGQSFLAIGQVRKGIDELTGEELNEYKTKINSAFWGGYLQINSKYKIPDAFYKTSEKYYYTNLASISGKPLDEFSYYEYGFWHGDNMYDSYFPKMKRGPKVEQDVEDFMNAIFSKSKAELDEALSYPLLKQKYDILMNYFKKELGFDLTKLAEVDFTKK